MAVLQGAVSIVWGNAVTGVTYTGSGWVTSSSESWSQESDSVEIKDMGGDTVGVYYYNYRNKLSLTVFPSGSSANVTLPTIGMKVTITSANDSKQAGDFVCTSISQDRKADGIVEFKMDLTKWDSLTVQ